MNRRPLWTLSLALLAAGCTCGALDANARFACSTNDDCGPGSVCAPVDGGLECVQAGAGGGGGGGAVGGGGGTGGANGCADAAGCPDRVAITTTVTTMLRYECRGPLRVELRDVNGVRNALRDTAVSLSVSLPGVTVHSVASCSDTALTTLTLPAGQSFFEVYLKADGQAFGTATLTATAAQVATAGQAMVEVHPQPIDHLEFTSAPRTVTAGQCSTDEVTLEFRDVQNRRTDVDAPTTITLASAPGDLLNANIFFSDAACAADGSSRQLQPGQGAVALHLLVRRAGTFVLTATPSAGRASVQQLTVVPAAGSKLAFTNAPLVLNTTQSCSPGLFTVQLQDPFDNPVTTAVNLRIRVLVATLVNVTLYDPVSLCTAAAQTDFTLAAGSTSVSFRARGMSAPPTLGTIQALAPDVADVAAASQALAISSGLATRFVVMGAAQNPLAGQCSANPLTIELRDSVGNAASSPTAMTFTLTTVPAADASFRFYSDAGCQTDLGGQLTVPAGQSSGTFYFRGNRAVALFEIRASGALTGPPTFVPGNSIRAAAPGKLVFGVPLSQTAQAGSCTSPYVVNVLDVFDNPASFSTAQTMTVSSNPPGVSVSASMCTVGNPVSLAANATQATFSAQHTITAPAYALTATVGGLSTPSPASLTVTPGPPTLMRDTPVGTASLQAGACQTITLTRRDAFGNNVPTVGPTTVTLSFPLSTSWVVYAGANCTGVGGSSINMNGTHTVTFSVSPRTAGNHQATATVAAQSVLIDFQVAAGPPARLTFTSPVQMIPAASCSAITTVTLQDTWGNTATSPSDRVVSFSAAPVVAITTFHSNATCSNPLAGSGSNQTTLSAGTSAATMYFKALIGNSSITLTADSPLLTSGSQVATIQ